VRVALISDVHANLPALEAVLEALGTCDALWHMGDVVGYGPHPVEVVERLAAAGAVGVRGNHDAAAVGAIDTEWFNEDARRAIEWTAGRLEPATRHWLEALPETLRLGDFTLVHGSLRDPTWEYVVSASSARESLARLETPYGLIGHSHLPCAFRDDGDRVITLVAEDSTEIGLDERRLLFNPGGVGQPRDGDPRAAGAILDTEAATVRWFRVPYPIEQTQAAMREVGLPRRLIERLSYGL